MAYQKNQVLLKSEQGSVLILVLVFSLSITLIAGVLLDTGILQTKIISNQKQRLNTYFEIEQQVCQLENSLANHFYQELPPHLRFLQFVPDSLLFNEKQGVDFYQIEVASWQQITSTFAVRHATALFDQTPVLEALKNNTVYQQLTQEHKSTLLVDKAFWDGRWHLLAMGVLSKWLFVFEVSPALQFTLLWKTFLESDDAPQPTLARFANGKWGIVLTQLGASRGMAIYDVSNGEKIRDFKLMNEAKACSQADFSQIAIVDTQNRGFADYIYVGDACLWKIDVQARYPSQWQVVMSTQMLGQKVLGQPLISAHPQGEGVIVHLVTQQPDGERTLYALWDHHHQLRPYCQQLERERSAFFHQPLLRSNLLIVPLIAPSPLVSKIQIYDVFSCQLKREQNFTFPSEALTDGEWIVPRIYTRAPRERKSLINLVAKNYLAEVEMEIDYAQLGRKTWQESP